jgi:hypothetical protein
MVNHVTILNQTNNNNNNNNNNNDDNDDDDVRKRHQYPCFNDIIFLSLRSYT